jgi:hypothetical protein
MTRVFIGQGRAYNQFLIGLAVLGFTVLGSAAWLAHILVAWSRKIARLESALAGRAVDRGDLPALARGASRISARIRWMRRTSRTPRVSRAAHSRIGPGWPKSEWLRSRVKI